MHGDLDRMLALAGDEATDLVAEAWVRTTSRDYVALAGDSKKPYGDVKYADPKNGKYPIDTKAHATAAWSYINKPKNASVYPLNGVSLSSVKAAIKSACKKFGIQISEDSKDDY